VLQNCFKPDFFNTIDPFQSFTGNGENGRKFWRRGHSGKPPSLGYQSPVGVADLLSFGGSRSKAREQPQ
jgi:hypothetical protein